MYKNKSIVIRTPYLSASQSELVIKKLTNVVGNIVKGSNSVDTIGPTLGSELLKTSFKSLIVAFICISLYISFRFDRRLALLALVALFVEIFSNLEIH